MQATLASHSVLADVKDKGHGSSPGDWYHHARCVLSRRGERYRCYLKCTQGSDQVYYSGGIYDEYDSYEACGRGDSIGDAIAQCRAELSSDDQLTYAAKQALSVAQDEAEEAEGACHEDV